MSEPDEEAEERADPFPITPKAPAAATCSALEVLNSAEPFTQVHLLTATEFADRANKRRFSLRAGHDLDLSALEELHRYGVLLPLFRIDSSVAQQTGDADVAYKPHGAVLARGAATGWIVDPHAEKFEPWDGRAEDFLYSPHQVLALDQVRGFLEVLEPFRAGMGSLLWRLPREYQPSQMALADSRKALLHCDGLPTWRSLAITLAAVDWVYWPLIVRRVVGDVAAWRSARLAFDPHEAASRLGVTLEALRSQVISLRVRASWCDSLGDIYDLVRRASPATWETLTGDARLAMDLRLAAEVLERFANDLDTDPPPPPNRLAPMTHQSLSVRLHSLDKALTKVHLSPHPSVVVGVEGPTELMLVPRVMELLGIEADPTWIRVECFEGAGANLALMARYAASPLLGTDHGEYVEVDRPPTRFLVLTDAEERYATPQDRREQRRNLIDAIAWPLPANLRPDLYDRSTRLVEILTWGRYPFEFAHFTDRQLADALLARAGKPHPRGREALINAITMQRTRNSAPDIEKAWKNSGVNKLALAEETWPLLETRIRRAIEHSRKGPPLMRGVLRAYELATYSPRANLVLRRHVRGRSIGR